ncbi:Stationary phase-inducible protein CsiE [Beauveria bassiana D1-5]|uniref:Stationary phase-inducible protein CsiE n=1 Tax=Beauveria bassiana D1-5 TaxID=1245745 RepID=A0A0A2WKU6_BEABA|nr:stationary phase inducible protein CsiE [Cedecea neteri]AJZ90649.1 stationary phase inducible protein CsiE [Klebsiella michiganensis]KGQ13689.1 Stationary phase-inducible protein CsiE [Beauveria bassiana D1-5]WPU24102.1 stationary phase inducible protein CsiE [Cedecea neteri]
MMTLLTPPPSVLSSSQRRCHLLLMLYLPEQSVTPEVISSLNGVDQRQTLQDIADTGHEIQSYHRLSLTQQQDGSYRIEGTILDRRLCLLHWLRRSLRLCPQFVQHHFGPALKSQLNQLGLIKALYDETNLRALVNLCGRRLKRQYDSRDSQFLTLFLQYCLHQHHSGNAPVLTPQQREWSQLRPEFAVAQEIARHWKRRVMQPANVDEQHFLALLFQLLRIPDPINDEHEQDARLHNEIARMIERFRRQAGLSFSDEQGLSDQLYIHLAQALNRCHFNIGIDHSLPEEITRLYPRLMRTSREVLADFEQHYGIQLSDAEAGLVAVIFGAWLMQESDIQEKQVLLLTADDRELEQNIEQQLRELTLLPLNIKHLAVQQFQSQGAPREVVLVITPYATSLPLFSPPLIHATLPLGDNQQQRIKALLEA